MNLVNLDTATTQIMKMKKYSKIVVVDGIGL